MRDARWLEERAASIDRRGYPAYKDLKGSYDFGDFVLSIDHVQGDPFAAPSSLSVFMDAREAGYPLDYVAEAHRRTALADRLLRAFSRELARSSFKAGGTGKSGLLATSRPGPEILVRSACTVDDHGAVTARFEAGFPAHGRTIDARAFNAMLLDLVPRCVRRALPCRSHEVDELRQVIELADDQLFLRNELERLGLVSFIADGSVLPRSSGVSSAPMRGAVPFASPESLRIAIDLPHRGSVAGMGIPRGVTLIVGGGYHGKSTLLKAIENGVYDHVAGDGREYVATDATAVKLRAEDGRAVHGVDVSMFIGNLPNGQDVRHFSTEDASGSTSQAAAAIEAIGTGCRTFLVDEDTSATNFMVRDALMQEVVARDHEPITPYVERVRDLYERSGVSSVIVAGSSGAFFFVADTVVQMDRYHAHDITERARTACTSHPDASVERAPGYRLPEARIPFGDVGQRDSDRVGRNGRRGPGRTTSRGDRLKVRTFGTDSLQVGNASADLRLMEQLVDPEQADAIAQMVRICLERDLLVGNTAEEAARYVCDLLDRKGLDALAEHGAVGCGLARPRLQEVAACLNRLRI